MVDQTTTRCSNCLRGYHHPMTGHAPEWCPCWCNPKPLPLMVDPTPEENPLIEVIFRFKDGAAISLPAKSPVAQRQAMPELGRLAVKLDLDLSRMEMPDGGRPFDDHG